VRGTVKNVTEADRVMAIVGTMAKAVNLLKVEVPAVEPQILAESAFANVDRSASTALGFNFASTAFNQTTAIGTGSSILSSTGSSLAGQALGTAVTSSLCVPILNLLAEIQALESKSLLEMLAEPNSLTYSGTKASFTAGGEFPYLTPQPSAGGTIFSVEFKPYGVLLNFLPRVTPQGTIHMQLSPEVSALDYTNTVVIQGTAVPGLTTRKVSTEVDLESGQTFVIAGLLDRQITEAFSKIPGLGDIPILGKLFQSKTSPGAIPQLLIIITPEIVRPLPASAACSRTEVDRAVHVQQIATSRCGSPEWMLPGPVPVHPPIQAMPIEQLLQQQKLIQAAPIGRAADMAPAGLPRRPRLLRRLPGQAPAGSGQGAGGNGGNAPAPAPGAGGGNGN